MNHLKLLLTITLGLFTATANAAAIDLNTDADTTLTRHPNLGGENANLGSNSGLYAIGPDAALSMPLVHFDLSAYSGQHVSGDATLSLFLSATWNYADVYNSVTVFPVLVNWTESTATYSNFGGSGYDGSQIGAALYDTGYRYWGADIGNWVDFTLPESLIQSWIDNPGDNNGLLLEAGNPANLTDLYFAAREYTDGAESYAPRLQVNLVPVPAALWLFGSGLAGLIGAARRGARVG